MEYSKRRKVFRALAASIDGCYDLATANSEHRERRLEILLKSDELLALRYDSKKYNVLSWVGK